MEQQSAAFHAADAAPSKVATIHSVLFGLIRKIFLPYIYIATIQSYPKMTKM